MLVLAHQNKMMEGSQPPWRKSYVVKAICRYIVEACCDTKHKELSKHVWEEFPAIYIQLSLATVTFKWISFSTVELLSLLTGELPGELSFALCVSTHSSVCWCFWGSGTFAEEQGTEAGYSRTKSHAPRGSLVLGSRLHLGYLTTPLWGLALVGLCFIPNTK